MTYIGDGVGVVSGSDGVAFAVLGLRFESNAGHSLHVVAHLAVPRA